jgi:penicillin-binding protein 2
MSERFRLRLLLCVISIGFLCTFINIISINDNTKIKQVSTNYGKYTVSTEYEYGTIYDCNMKRLNNLTTKYMAAVNPAPDALTEVMPHAVDKQSFLKNMQNNVPFLCEVDTPDIFNDNVTVFETIVRTDKAQLAPNIVGYLSYGTGVCGIEKAFDDVLRRNKTRNTVTYNVNAVGDVLNGTKISKKNPSTVISGVVTTLDSDIQKICEESAKSIDKGAVLVMDVSTGEIKACVSKPTFDVTNVSASLDSTDSPFINRAFSAYNVGSIFKLVTAGTALESGISPEYTYTCTGKINVDEVEFNCHKFGGHGELDMCSAITESCNTYFIALSEYIDSRKFLDTAKKIGFGKESILCDGIVSSSGTIQTLEDLKMPAEKANMSFGQGKLTATPLQITLLTATIANNGLTPVPQLISGEVDANNNFVSYSEFSVSRSISADTAKTLKKFMVETVNSPKSLAKPFLVEAGGKTSTAQTGRFDKDGTEYVTCWFTGFFPVDKPKYAVTVLVEDGITGNISCGSVFKSIADKVYAYKNNNYNGKMY